MKDFDNLKDDVLKSYIDSIDSRIEALYEALALLYMLCEGLDIDESYMDDLKDLIEKLQNSRMV